MAKYKHPFVTTPAIPVAHPSPPVTGDGPNPLVINTAVCPDARVPGILYTHYDGGTVPDLEGSPSMSFVARYATAGPHRGKPPPLVKDNDEKT